MLRALLPLNGPFVPVSRSKISGAITVQKAVDIATSAPLTKGARVVGASLVRVVTVPAVLTTTVWLVLVDPPGSHRVHVARARSDESELPCERLCGRR